MFIHIVGFYTLCSIFQYINSQEEEFSFENVYRTLEETKWISGKADWVRTSVRSQSKKPHQNVLLKLANPQNIL